MAKLYVVAWEYNGGGGFDWYPHKHDALKGLMKERKNEVEFKKDNWKAYYFEISLSDIAEDVTNMLQSIVDTKIDERNS